MLRQKCQEKTHRGNIYGDINAAMDAADKMSRQHGHIIQAFKCGVCSKYHIGRPDRRCVDEQTYSTEIEAKRKAKILLMENLTLTVIQHCDKCSRWHLIEK